MKKLYFYLICGLTALMMNSCFEDKSDCRVSWGFAMGEDDVHADECNIFENDRKVYDAFDEVFYQAGTGRIDGLYHTTFFQLMRKSKWEKQIRDYAETAAAQLPADHVTPTDLPFRVIGKFGGEGENVVIWEKKFE
ncbi:MAG: hypothetical protein MJZ82_04645 [Paludibacteraceae bacterium]|nr:hypothetical protein [Paludibacteraceae bacterium]